MTKQFFSIGTGMLTAMIIGLAGCGGSSDTSDSTIASSDGLGEIKVLLTDDPASYQAVYVTIDEIQVKKRDGNASESNASNKWVTVAEPYRTYDLLTLQNGVTAELGETNISVGTYSELRLVLGAEEDNGTNILGDSHPYANYIVFIGDDVAELQVPSSRLMQKHDFEVNETGVVEMTIDFDANRSIHQAGNSGQWILTPVLGITDRHLGKKESAETADAPEEFDAFDEFKEYDEPEAALPDSDADDTEDTEAGDGDSNVSEPVDNGGTPDAIA